MHSVNDCCHLGYILAVPIFGEVSEEGINEPPIVMIIGEEEASEKQLLVENSEKERPKSQTPHLDKIIEGLWRQQCKIEGDFERYLPMNHHYSACKFFTLNHSQKKQIRQEMQSLTNAFTLNNLTLAYEQKVQLVDVVQKFVENFFSYVCFNNLFIFCFRYCTPLRNYFNCGDFLLPIYSECFTAKEIKGLKLRNEIFIRITDFFCISWAEHVKQYIDGNVIECAFAANDELAGCFNQYFHATSTVDENPFFDFPKPDILCR